MSATFNWAYRPGVSNKYGFTVPAGADNVRPTGWCYVALFGNDTTGNGSRQYPFRTITKACATITGRFYAVLASGVYREFATIPEAIGGMNIVGDGDVTLDVTYTSQFYNGGGNNMAFGYNLNIKGDGNSIFQGAHYSCTFEDCVFDGCALSVNFSAVNHSAKNCVIANISAQCYLNNPTIDNCTFVNCSNIYCRDQGSYRIRGCIFKKSNICADPAIWTKTSYSLFYQCNYKFSSGGIGGVLYPAVPAGYNFYSSIINLQSAYNTFTGQMACYGCIIADPLFNNESIGDYSLAFNSPAKNLSYFGTYVGARSIAHTIGVNSTEDLGAFEFSSAVNVTISNDSIILTDPAADAQIDTKVIVNSLGRELTSFRSYGFNADRNGQYIDSIADLAAVTKTANDTLAVPAAYLVEGGAIVYNGITYTSGSRFTTITGQTSFTTSTGAVLREILEAPQRHTIMARFSDGGSNVFAGEALVTGNYYYIQAGSVTYENKNYDTGDVFKAVNSNSFSGQGTVIVAFSNESYQHYEFGIRPTTNNAGNLRTGTIIRGNGDPAYVRGGLGIQEFPVNAKFIQIRYHIKANNLKP